MQFPGLDDFQQFGFQSGSGGLLSVEPVGVPMEVLKLLPGQFQELLRVGKPRAKPRVNPSILLVQEIAEGAEALVFGIHFPSQRED